TQGLCGSARLPPSPYVQTSQSSVTHRAKRSGNGDGTLAPATTLWWRVDDPAGRTRPLRTFQCRQPSSSHLFEPTAAKQPRRLESLAALGLPPMARAFLTQSPEPPRRQSA